MRFKQAGQATPSRVKIKFWLCKSLRVSKVQSSFEQRPHQVQPSNDMRENDPPETFNMSKDQNLNVQNVKNFEYK
jgi:hypothetical protein